MIKLVLLASLISLPVARRAQAADFFIVADTLKSQRDAQDRAALVERVGRYARQPSAAERQYR
jgi:hypothetical protein